LTCPFFQSNQCDIFDWIGPSPCPWALEVGLLVQEKIQKLEKEIGQLKMKGEVAISLRRQKLYLGMLVGSWMLFGLYIAVNHFGMKSAKYGYYLP